MGLVCSIEVGLDVDVVVLDVNLLQIHTHSSSGILPFTGGRVTGHERGGRGPKRPKKNAFDAFVVRNFYYPN